MVRNETDRSIFCIFCRRAVFLARNPQKSAIPAAAAANRRRQFVHDFLTPPCQRAARMQGGGVSRGKPGRRPDPISRNPNTFAAPDLFRGPGATRKASARGSWSPDLRCAPSGAATKGASGACPERSRRADPKGVACSTFDKLRTGSWTPDLRCAPSGVARQGRIRGRQGAPAPLLWVSPATRPGVEKDFFPLPQGFLCETVSRRNTCPSPSSEDSSAKVGQSQSGWRRRPRDTPPPRGGG